MMDWEACVKHHVQYLKQKANEIVKVLREKAGVSGQKNNKRKRNDLPPSRFIQPKIDVYQSSSVTMSVFSNLLNESVPDTQHFKKALIQFRKMTEMVSILGYCGESWLRPCVYIYKYLFILLRIIREVKQNTEHFQTYHFLFQFYLNIYYIMIFYHW